MSLLFLHEFEIVSYFVPDLLIHSPLSMLFVSTDFYNIFKPCLEEGVLFIPPPPSISPALPWCLSFILAGIESQTIKLGGSSISYLYPSPPHISLPFSIPPRFSPLSCLHAYCLYSGLISITSWSQTAGWGISLPGSGIHAEMNTGVTTSTTAAKATGPLDCIWSFKVRPEFGVAAPMRICWSLRFSFICSPRWYFWQKRPKYTFNFRVSSKDLTQVNGCQ